MAPASHPPAPPSCMQPVAASVLLTVPELDWLPPAVLEGKTVRQISTGTRESKGLDIGEFMVVQDVLEATLYPAGASSRPWVMYSKNVNLSNAPTLAYIPTGLPTVRGTVCSCLCARYSSPLTRVLSTSPREACSVCAIQLSSHPCSLHLTQGGMLAVVHPSDLANILRKHPKMQELELARKQFSQSVDEDGNTHRIVDSRGMIRIPASTLQTLPGFGDLDAKLFEGKTMRQMGRGRVDEDGNNVSGYFVVSDAGALVLFEDYQNARRWASNICQVNIRIAPSLTYVDSEGGKLAVVHPSDLANILRTHPKMLELQLARTPMPPLEALVPWILPECPRTTPSAATPATCTPCDNSSIRCRTSARWR